MKSIIDFDGDKLGYRNYLREYFAAMAMQGLIAQMDRYTDSEFDDNVATLTSDAVAISDALLKALAS